MGMDLPSGRPSRRVRALRNGTAVTLTLFAAAGCFAACGNNDSPPPSSAPTPGTPSSTPSGPLSSKAQLESDTGASWLVELDPTFGAVRFAMPREPARPLLAPNQTREQAVSAFIQKYNGVFNLGTSALTSSNTTFDAQGGSIITFAQGVNGVHVHGAQITVHLDATFAVTFINGLWVPQAASVPTTAAVSNANAISIVEADLAKNYPGFSAQKEIAQNATLEIDPYAAKGPTLVVQVFISAPGLSKHYEIDAQSGLVLMSEDQIESIAGTGKGISYYATNANHNASDVKSFQVDQSGGGVDGGTSNFTMHAAKNGTADELTIYDYNSGNPRFVVNSSDPNTWDTTGNGPGTAVDAFVTMAKVDAFYSKVFGRQSYDNAGSKVDVVVHQWDAFASPPTPYMCNAFFDKGGLFMAFGDGDWRNGIGPVGGTPSSDGGAGDDGGTGVDPGTCYPLAAALDVSAHEYTHAIVAKELNLDFTFEPGAMDESFADIFGGFCEHNDTPNDTLNMEIGEEGWIVPGNAPLRSAADPSKGIENDGKEPDNYSKLMVLGANDDAGGRHANSTIPSQAFFLMTLGGTNKTSQVTVSNPLGWDNSQKLWYAILTQSKMSSSAKFADEAKASLAQAKQLSLNLEPVACAWVATGVLDNAFVRDNFNVLCGCPGQDGGASQDPSTFACCDPAIDSGNGGDASADECCKVCSEAGEASTLTSEASTPITDGDSPDVQIYDSCTGRADGVYCSQLQSFSAIVCQGGSIAGGQQCPGDEKCAGPNGAGTQIQCQ